MESGVFRFGSWRREKRHQIDHILEIKGEGDITLDSDSAALLSTTRLHRERDMIWFGFLYALKVGKESKEMCAVLCCVIGVVV